MKQLKALTKAADVCCAAGMRPDPALPAFSMEPPLRVAQALLQSLAVLLPFLLTCPPPTHAAFKEHSVAFRTDKGRPVPARLSLQQKLDQASVKRLIGERREVTLKAFESFT